MDALMENERTRGREAGVVLLTLALVLIVVLGITGSVLMVSLSEAKAVTEATNQRMAFYFAEGGLEAAKQEVGESADPDGDGQGNRTRSTSEGAYAVTAEDLGGGTYKLTSTGNSGSSGVTLETVIRMETTTIFPPGAVTSVGGLDKTKIVFRNDAGLILDGGNSPAASFTDQGLYEDFGSKLADAISKGKLPLENITGFPESPFGEKEEEVELPIYLGTEYPEGLDDLESLYTQLVNAVNKTIIPKAEVITSATNTVDKKADAKDLQAGLSTVDKYAFGSSSSPATIYMPEDVTLEQGEKISGYGTLVIGDQLQLKAGSRLDWHGSVIIAGNEKKKATLLIDGDFKVDGNVVVVGEAMEFAEFKVSQHASAAIDGSFLAATGYTDKTKQVKVSMDGELTVNGLFTLMGGKVSTKFKNDSEFTLNGMLQMAIPESYKKTSLKLEFDGIVEIHKDSGQIQHGANALEELGALWNITEIGTLLTKQVVTCSWRQVSG